MALKVRQLEAFQAVMLAGSMTGASGLLHISQPAVSQLIAQLEQTCGFMLFTRTGSRIQPSREAELLYSEIERMFGEVSKVERVVASIRDHQWGEIAIAAFPAMISRWLPEVLFEFCQNRPHLRVTLESRPPRTIVDLVASRRVDFGIGVVGGDRDEVDSELLCSCPAVCILRADHHLTIRSEIRASDLANEPFISLGKEDGSRVAIDRAFEEAGIPRKLQVECAQSQAACAFVAQGAGLAIVDPFSVYKLGNDSGIVVKPFEPQIPFRLWLLLPHGKNNSRLTDQFIGLLKKRLQSFLGSTV